MAGDWTIGINFAAIGDEIRAKIPGAVLKGMEHVHTVVTPLVPVETSNLAGSGDVSVVGDEASLFYPGPYALYQHDGVYYRHGRFGAPLTHTHGESFFLQRPMVQEAPRVIGIIEHELFG